MSRQLKKKSIGDGSTILSDDVVNSFKLLSTGGSFNGRVRMCSCECGKQGYGFAPVENILAMDAEKKEVAESLTGELGRSWSG